MMHALTRRGPCTLGTISPPDHHSSSPPHCATSRPPLSLLFHGQRRYRGSTRQNALTNPPPPSPPHALRPRTHPPAHINPRNPHPHPAEPVPAFYLDNRPRITIQWTTDTAADARDEGAVEREEDVRWVQERAEKEGQVCVYYLRQESEA